MYIFPNSVLLKVPEDMPADLAVFVEEMAVAYSSFARATQPYPAINEGFEPGDSAVILGNGPLGILSEIVKGMDIVHNPNRCMKVQVVPHKP